MKCSQHSGKGRAPKDCVECAKLEGQVKVATYETKKCSAHSGRGRMPTDCEACATLNGLEVMVVEEYPVPKVDDTRQVFNKGDKVLRPLFNLFNSWENQLRFAKVGVVQEVSGSKLVVKYKDGNVFTVDSGLCVAVI